MDSKSSYMHNNNTNRHNIIRIATNGCLLISEYSPKMPIYNPQMPLPEYILSLFWEHLEFLHQVVAKYPLFYLIILFLNLKSEQNNMQMTKLISLNDQNTYSV